MRQNLCDSFVRQSARILVLIALIAPMTLAPQFGRDAFAGDAGLFSEISMAEVMASSSKKSSKTPSVPSQLLGAEGLSKLLDSAEVKYQKQDSRIRVQPTEILSDAGTAENTKKAFSFEMTVDPEAERIHIVLPLRQTDLNANVDGKRLMRLLVTASKQNGISLAASQSNLSLRGSVSNQAVDVDQIKDQCKRLAQLATLLEPLLSQVSVSISSPQGSNKTQTTPQPTKPTAKPSQPAAVASKATQPSISLAGTWSAKVDKDNAWAVAFASDGNYTMVHTKGKKNAISKGSFLNKGGKLTLKETGAQSLTGKLVMVSQTAFSWSILKPDGSVALKLNFTKK